MCQNIVKSHPKFDQQKRVMLWQLTLCTTRPLARQTSISLSTFSSDSSGADVHDTSLCSCARGSGAWGGTPGHRYDFSSPSQPQMRLHADVQALSCSSTHSHTASEHVRGATTHLEHAEVVGKAVALGRGRQHDLRTEHRGERERRDVAVLLVDEPRARGVPQQHLQPLVDAALCAACLAIGGTWCWATGA